MKTLAGALLALVAYASATWLGVSFEALAPATHGDSSHDLIYLPTPSQARLMSLGFSNVMADFYWVKALQYFTDPTQARNRFKNLADYLDLVVGIDPDYEYAYKFAALAIPYDSGRFHFVNTTRATSFLERGIARFPNNWQLHFLLGYHYLNFSQNPIRAAEQFAAAAKLPGAPSYFAPFAARLMAVGGEVDRAIEFTTQELNNNPTPELEALLKSRLVDLKVEKELRRIEAAAKAFLARNGRPAVSLDELIAAGLENVPRGYSLGADGIAHTVMRADRMIVYQSADEPVIRGE